MISEIQLYPKTIRVKRPSTSTRRAPTPPNRAGSEIQGFSRKSRSRLRFVATNAEGICSQFLCTYADTWPQDGRASKQHLNTFLTAVRRAFPAVKYIWTAEFQTRNAPHVHLFSSIPATAENRETLARIWHRIADPGNPKHLAFHRHPRNFFPWELRTGSYLCKHLDPRHQKAVPENFYNFGRFWGNSRGLIGAPETITPATIEADFPQVDETTGEVREDALKFLVRIVGRYHERKNPRSWFRNTARTATVLTGAPVFRQAFEYLRRARGKALQPTPKEKKNTEMLTDTYENLSDPTNLDIDSALALGAALLAAFRTTCDADPAAFARWLEVRSRMTPATACRYMLLTGQADALADERGLDLATAEALAHLEIDAESLPDAELDDHGHIAWKLLRFPPSDRLTPVLA